jgi:ADP-ribosyl-[dinitrogen reductase] hydrolase
MTPAERFAGCLLGCALGDSLLLPAEGLSRAAVARRFTGPLRHRLVGGWGMVSDDTEHTFLAAQAMLAAGDDADLFARQLARRLRWWLLGVPAGCGRATALGLLRAWCGVPPGRSGIVSAGNGPAMRSAIIGLRWAEDADRRHAFIAASTAITHRDQRALTAALAVAEAAAWTTQGGEETALWQTWRGLDADAGWQRLCDLMHAHLADRKPVEALAEALDCTRGVSGYAMHSVPVALYAWLRHRHAPEDGLGAILACGGDTDTVGAIAGALYGCDDGERGFPAAWIDGIRDWPLAPHRLRAAAAALARPDGVPVAWAWPLLPLRNAVFLVIVLAHGLRRLSPF